MTHMTIARSYLGTKELKGSSDNPKIMEMYRTVGHHWVEHDEVAWCAAFVGHCLEKAGTDSARKLNARSYLTWGEKVAGVEQAKEGDVVIFTRGSNTAQGHVAFFLKATGQQIEVLGGNQSDGVTVARYAKSRLLGIRRPLRADAPQRPEMKVVQQQLKDLGYFEVGIVDGRYGPRTRAAVLAFRADNPKIFLFDEPLSNLDAELRVRMRLEIAKLHARLGATMIYVTHDQAEAMTLASRIVVLRAGLVEQSGSPMSLYENPDNRFVAGFIGSPRMNFLPARLTDRGAAGEAIISVPSLGGLSLGVRPRNPTAVLPDALTLGIRPEHFRTESATGAFLVPFRVEAVEQFGNVSLLHSHGELSDGLVAEWRGPGRPAVGDSVPMFADAASCMLFDEVGTRL